MSVVQARIHEKYKYSFEKVLNYLLKGLEYFSVFTQYLDEKTGSTCNDDYKYIAEVLFPLIEKAKTEFDEMNAYAESLLQQIHSDFERCVADLKVNDDKLKEIDSYLNALVEELQGTEKAVDNANDQCRRKREDLSDAENALSDARSELEDKIRTQEKTIVAGVTTTVASAFLTLFVPPVGIVGMAAGLGAGIVGITTHREAVLMCSNNVRSARDVVEWSESALERARKAKFEVENKLDRVNMMQQQIQAKLEEVKNDKKRLDESRDIYIIFAEDCKKFHHKLSDFYGKYKVLRCETSGGYSLDLLQSPTKIICVSISSLCHSAVMKELCERLMLTVVRKRLLKIECVQSHAPEQVLEMKDYFVISFVIYLFIVYIINLLSS